MAKIWIQANSMSGLSKALVVVLLLALLAILVAIFVAFVGLAVALVWRSATWWVELFGWPVFWQ